MTPKQEKLLNKINELGRLLNEEEIIDFYIENNTRGICYKIPVVGGDLIIENRLWQVKEKAVNCYTYGLGRLVLAGAFKLNEEYQCQV